MDMSKTSVHMWMQWKRPRTRYKYLLRLELEEDRARRLAWNGLGAWCKPYEPSHTSVNFREDRASFPLPSNGKVQYSL